MFRENSPPTKVYNCVAFAYGREDKWFDPWPKDKPVTIKGVVPFWPDGIPHEMTLDSFISLFKSIGYVNH